MEEDNEVYEDNQDLESERESEDSQDDNEEDEEFQIVQSMRKEISTRNLSEVKSKIIRKFSKLVSWQPVEGAIPDHRGKYRDEEKVYSKLINCSVNVHFILNLLDKNENLESRELTIFIARQKWISSQLSHLMELCSKDDNVTVIRCCQLLIFLMKRMRKQSLDALNFGTKVKKSIEETDLTPEEAAAIKEADKALNDKKKLSFEKQLAILQNAKEQLQAQISFKESLCSISCIQAIVNTFRIAWAKWNNEEFDIEDKKGIKDVLICIGFVRRVLAIDTHPKYSTSSEIASCKKLHYTYLVNFRPILQVFTAVCADLMIINDSGAYRPNIRYDELLQDVILILVFMLKDFNARDMFKIWREKSLISLLDLEVNSNEEDFDMDAIEKRPVPAVTIPEKFSKQGKLQNEATKQGGLLSKLLSQQRQDRLQNNFNGNRLRCGGGVFTTNAPDVANMSTANSVAIPPQTLPSSSATNNNNTVDPDKLNSSEKVKNPFPIHVSVKSSDVIRNIFDKQVRNIPQLKTRRNKKHLSFIIEDKVSENIQSKTLDTEEGQKALVVISSLLETLTHFEDGVTSSFPGLCQLIKRVNYDRQRDDGKISPELEVQYFGVIAKGLMYNRLKLSEQKARQMKYANELEYPNVDHDNNSNDWNPELKNVLDALRIPTFQRVFSTMSRLLLSKQYVELTIPMEMYKEQICYLRVLIESANESYNDFAVAALYRIFYSSERSDFLPKLLQSWKPGLFDKKFMLVLVELCYETLKTLDAASAKYRSRVDKALVNGEKSKSKKSKSKEVDLEQYIAGCIGFDVNEYFKRLVTNQTIMLYVKLLGEYKTLDTVTCHHIYCFMQRVCNFKLEQSYPAPLSSTIPISQENEFLSSNPSKSSELTLAFMFFNTRSLGTFSEILNDPRVESSEYSYLSSLVKLIKFITRRFFEAASKNHLLFVEALFTHHQAHNMCESIDSVYEATSYYTRHQQPSSNAEEAIKDSTTAVDIDSESLEREVDDRNMEDLFRANKIIGEEEFDENDLIFSPEENIASKISKKKNSKKISKKNDDSDIDTNTDGDDENSDDINDFRIKKTKKTKVSSKKSSKKSAWTNEEDAILKEEYLKYKGTRTVFSMIAGNLQDIGNHRSTADVEKRVLELNLHMSSPDDDTNETNVLSQEISDEIFSPVKGNSNAELQNSLDDLDDDNASTSSDLKRNIEKPKLLKNKKAKLSIESTATTNGYASDDDFFEETTMSQESQKLHLPIVTTKSQIIDDDEF